MGFSYANLALKSKKDGNYLVYTLCKNAEGGKAEEEKIILKVTNQPVYFRVKVTEGAKCKFSYSMDGQVFTDAGAEFQAEVGRWKGAKVGLFATRETQINDSGFADFDWFRVEPLNSFLLTSRYRSSRTTVRELLNEKGFSSDRALTFSFTFGIRKYFRF
jgi:hypothetical protein